MVQQKNTARATPSLSSFPAEIPAPRKLGVMLLWILSVLVGAVAGLGAIAFRALIAVVHNLLFLGKLDLHYNANIHTPISPWGAGVILVPVLGAVGVVFLVKNFAPEAKGHGVPEVMESVYHHRGIIRPVVSLVKAVASALSIGSGGSIGREGPIIQIGASFGSTIGQLLRLPVWQRVTLIAAGAGGGIAATFNTPVGGLLFAVEIVMHEVSARTLVPVITATATATYIGRLFFGVHPSFSIPSLEVPAFIIARPLILGAYVGLGIIAGLVSALFIKSIYGFEHVFEKRVRGGYYVQHILGMLLVGLLIYGLYSAFGHYFVEGVGYATVQDLLTSVPYPLWLIALLFAAKLLATSLTLGSGASGGVFSPALFLGATSGIVYAQVLKLLFPALPLSPAAFALAGMAAVVGGSTGAAMAAIVMIFEMTLDYRVILPITLVVAISYALRKTLSKDSIYTRKLTLRGSLVPGILRADLQFSRRARELMNPHVLAVPMSADLVPPASTTPEQPRAFIFTNPSGEIVGIAAKPEVHRQSWPASISQEGGPYTTYAAVGGEDSLWDVIRKMDAVGASVALVTNSEAQSTASAVQGVITLQDVLALLAHDYELFG